MRAARLVTLCKLGRVTSASTVPLAAPACFLLLTPVALGPATATELAELVPSAPSSRGEDRSGWRGEVGRDGKDEVEGVGMGV